MTATDSMTETSMRTERDSMGEVQVPANAYYGAQTQRAVDNFPVSGWRIPNELIHAMGRVKTCLRNRQSRPWQNDGHR